MELASLFYLLKPNVNLQLSQSKISIKRLYKASIKEFKQDFPGGAVVKNLPVNAGITGSIPGLGRSHMPQSN